jgi:small subunit ribosomal protein S2
MAMPTFTMRELMEAGVHFGHHTRRWNPKMKEYIFGVRNNVHIIDLQQTVPMLDASLKAVRDTVARGGRVLFVGTKHQAQEKIAEAAKRCGQYYVNHRWLGGMLTNWKTVSKSIARLRELEKLLAQENTGLTKKEELMSQRELNKLELSLGGIKDMAGQPDIIFLIDTNKEAIAIQEANNLKIPVVGVIDTNSDPAGVDFPVPGNDDALRSISFYCDLIADAALDGLQAEITASGKDVGEQVDVKVDLPKEEKADAAKEEKKAASA